MTPKRSAACAVAGFAIAIVAGMIRPDVSLVAIGFVSGMFFGIAITIAVLDDMEKQP